PQGSAEARTLLPAQFHLAGHKPFSFRARRALGRDTGEDRQLQALSGTDRPTRHLCRCWIESGPARAPAGSGPMWEIATVLTSFTPNSRPPSKYCLRFLNIAS